MTNLYYVTDGGLVVNEEYTGDSPSSGTVLPFTTNYATSAGYSTSAEYAISAVSATSAGVITTNQHPEVWDDILVTPSSVTLPASQAPAWADWLTNLRILEFVNAEDSIVHFSAQMSHTYKPGSDIKWHVHFAPLTSITSGQTVTWRLDYSVSSVNGTFGATTSALATYTSPSGATAANQHCIAACSTDFSGVGLSPSFIILAKLTRLSSTDTFAGSVGLLGTDFHYIRNRFGTSSEYS